MNLTDLTVPDRRWMQRAIREAESALERNEVPVGAVVIHRNTIVGKGANMMEQLKDPTAHAELIAITAACDTLDTKVLDDCTLYVTLEPCPMCAGASVLARIPRLVFGAFDEKAGAAGTLYNIVQDKRLNHRIEVVSGIEEDRCAALLRSFFHHKRRNDQQRPI